MGLFDTVKLNEPPKCPGCGEVLWLQTKDTEYPYLETYTEDQLAEVGIDNFGAYCTRCHIGVEWNRRIERTAGLDQFEMTVTLHAAPGAEKGVG